jgi:enoyl-CoA hydratase
MSTLETIQVEWDRRVAVVTLSRSQARNALNTQLMLEVSSTLRELDRDPDVGAIVLAGSAKAFAAGADIKEMQQQSFADVYVGDWFAAWDELSRVRTPLVAAVAGYAFGGGCELDAPLVSTAGEGDWLDEPQVPDLWRGRVDVVVDLAGDVALEAAHDPGPP